MRIIIDWLGLEPSLTKKIKGPGDGATYEEEQKEEKVAYQNPFPQDADDEDFLKSSEDEKSEKEDEEEEESDDESDDEKLFEEYERIKREREEEQKRKVKFFVAWIFLKTKIIESRRGRKFTRRKRWRTHERQSFIGWIFLFFGKEVRLLK